MGAHGDLEFLAGLSRSSDFEEARAGAVARLLASSFGAPAGQRTALRQLAVWRASRSVRCPPMFLVMTIDSSGSARD
jgi:hypothetical protein